MLAQINSFRYQPSWFWLILALAIVLRFWIATYNTEANDSHLHVIHKIMATGQLPAVDDCFQCYHVKGFHYPAAVLLARLSIGNPIDQLRLLQYGNVVLGVFTILFLWAWLKQRPMDDKWKLALFALVALNPRFATINTQVTNDTLVIFAATASFFFYTRFLETRKFLNLWTVLMFGALAVASKASGLVVALLIMGHLFILAAVHLQHVIRLKTKVAVFILLVGTAAWLVPYSGYVQNAGQAGTALANNVQKRPFPNWQQEKRWNQAGTTSIVNTYFTFPWLGLVKYPYINNVVDGVSSYPEHRTNHWAQLYGRHAFSRFDRWPNRWGTNGYWTTRIGRASMFLSLVPLGILLAGIASLGIDSFRGISGGTSFRRLTKDPEIFLAMTAVALFAMSLKLSLDFQTYGIMKAVYIYPALIGILALLVRGREVIRRTIPAGMGNTLRRLILCLLVIHVLDLSVLATDLQARYADRVQQLATFEPIDVKANQVRLDRLARTNLIEQTGETRINESYTGLDLTGGYRKYEFGFGSRDSSSMAFALNKDYAYFETSMALADEADSADGVQFEIWGDTRLLYRGPILIDGEVDEVRLDVSDVDVMFLKVQILGSAYDDLANWLHPVLTRKNKSSTSNVDRILR